MEAMRLPWHKLDLLKYSFPVACVVSACGWFEHRIPLPEAAGKKHSLTFRLHDYIDLQRSLQLDSVAWHDMVALGDPSRFLVWKCDSIALNVERAFKAKLHNFRWPLFPHIARQLGMRVTSEPEPISPIASILPAESDEEENDDDPEHFRQEQTCYKAEVLLRFLRFRSLLKSGVHMREALCLAAEILGLNSDRFRDPKTFRVPAESTMQNAHVKLDSCFMWWSRRLWNGGFRAACSLQADASEQKHVEYMCQRLDVQPIRLGHEQPLQSAYVFARRSRWLSSRTARRLLRIRHEFSCTLPG